MPSNDIRKKILIVGDPDLTLTYKVGLESNGFQVTVYNDPLVALSNFKSNFYDLLLLDIKMPKMNGFELHEKIEEKTDDHTRVCFITALEVNYEALREISSTLDVDCFIQKPILIHELINRINIELH
jgi:DNA-binding response OmpR family regulator